MKRGSDVINLFVVSERGGGGGVVVRAAAPLGSH